MNKRSLAFLLIVTIILFCCSFLTCNAETYVSGGQEDNITWNLDEKGTLTISGSGEMRDYSYNSSEHAPWYPMRSEIRAVIIEQGITRIGQLAFYQCYDLWKISIPDSVTSVNLQAFEGCDLQSLIIPDSVTSISGVLHGCINLRSFTTPFVTIGSDGTSIFGNYFFNKSVPSSLKEVVITGDISNIPNSAFSGCNSIESITLPDSVTGIGDYAFNSCSSLANITIPDSVTSIGDYAFSRCSSLANITIPDGVSSIGQGTFGGCSSLTSITIPDSITNIGENAFSGCSSLTSITIPDSVTNIGESTFSGCEKAIFYVADNSFAHSFVRNKKYKYDLFSGHTVVVDEAIEPECTHAGRTESSHCETCGEVFKAQEEIPAVGHDWNTEPTIDKYVTCTEDGVESVHCTRCDAVKEGSEKIIPKTGHHLSAWTVITAPTEISVGIQRRTCSSCGKTETSVIAQLAPTLPAVRISKPKAAKRAATVKWKKVSKKNRKLIQGVEIQVAADPGFTSIVRTAYAGKKKTSKKIKGLEKGYTYYVRVRAYNGWHVSAWSGTKAVRIKK